MGKSSPISEQKDTLPRLNPSQKKQKIRHKADDSKWSFDFTIMTTATTTTTTTTTTNGDNSDNANRAFHKDKRVDNKELLAGRHDTKALAINKGERP